jgi:hypothetical protein
MDTLHNKTTLMVAIATIIASAMILLTGNTVADSKDQAKTIVTDIEPKSLSGENSAVIVSKEIELGKTPKRIMLDPPPGPFFRGEASIASRKNALVAPVAPTKPISNLQTPEAKANSLEFKMVSPLLPKKLGSAPIANKMPQNNTKQPMMNTGNTPIWMQKGNIVNQGSNASMSGMNQGNNANIQNQRVMPKTGWNYPVQQYMYVPVPMMVPSTMPQMPLAPNFNYGAPMPFYNNAPLNNNTSQAVDKIATPVQKGINK